MRRQDVAGHWGWGGGGDWGCIKEDEEEEGRIGKKGGDEAEEMEGKARRGIGREEMK